MKLSECSKNEESAAYPESLRNTDNIHGNLDLAVVRALHGMAYTNVDKQAYYLTG